MGGLYGNAAATALEDCPTAARGLMSGLLQQGYAFGYLLCAAFARALVNTTPHGWRPLFWFDACVPPLLIAWRAMLPETSAYLAQRRTRQDKAAAAGAGGETGAFLRDGVAVLRGDWLVLVYLVLLMAGFNFMAHGSQDLYPEMLRSQLGFTPDMVTLTQVAANFGAILGGSSVGFASQVFGRRLSILRLLRRRRCTPLSLHLCLLARRRRCRLLRAVLCPGRLGRRPRSPHRVVPPCIQHFHCRHELPAR